VTKQLDKQTGFSKKLVQVENNVRNEDWSQAETNIEDAKKTWEKIKPFMQIDIDHDYIKDIEDNFTKLKGYVDTKDKPNSLPTIMLIQETWENIDSL
jgi:archaellum component FlaC